MHKVGAVKHAQTAERIGCDAVSIVCFESGGHPLPDDIGASVLIPACVAALAIGAEGVMMGTRFTMSQECNLHPKLKEWFTKLSIQDTMLVHRAINNNERVVRTQFTEKILALEESGAGLDQILPLISGDKVRIAYETGDVENAIITAGQVVGLIHDILSVKEIIDRIMLEAENVVTSLNRALAATKRGECGI